MCWGVSSTFLTAPHTLLEAFSSTGRDIEEHGPHGLWLLFPWALHHPQKVSISFLYWSGAVVYLDEGKTPEGKTPFG